MGETTGIAWAHRTFNPWIGCTKCSPECEHCYVEPYCKRTGLVGFGGKERRVTSAEYWKQPMRWYKKLAAEGRRERVFLSLCDPFDEQGPQYARTRLWSTIAATSGAIQGRIPEVGGIDWLLCTKRPGRIGVVMQDDHIRPGFFERNGVWLGATVGCKRSYFRLPALFGINARFHFVSMEPLLEDTPIPSWLDREIGPALDWVVVGCESGGKRRPMELQWARNLRDECQAAQVAFFMKQMEVGGKVTDELNLFPDDLRIREFPQEREP